MSVRLREPYSSTRSYFLFNITIFKTGAKRPDLVRLLISASVIQDPVASCF